MMNHIIKEPEKSVKLDKYISTRFSSRHQKMLSKGYHLFGTMLAQTKFGHKRNPISIEDIIVEFFQLSFD